MAPSPHRPEVAAVMNGLIALEILTANIIRFHSQLREDYQRRGHGKIPPSLPPGFDYDDLPPLEPDPAKRSAILMQRLKVFDGRSGAATLRRWSHARDQLAFSIRDWRDELHHTRKRLSTVAELMDDPKVFAAGRWTARLRGLLNELGGCLPALGTFPAIDDATLADALDSCLTRLRAFTDGLKVIGPPDSEGALPIRLAPAVGDTDAIDRVAEGEAAKVAHVFGGDDGAEANGSEGTQPEAAKADDGEYRPATWFKKGMADRLRQAASKNRKTKRVAKREIDGVVCYCVADARRWWPSDVPKEA